MSYSSDDSVLEKVISLSQVVFADQHYEAARHLLHAAIHVAADLQDETQLLQIEQLAIDQHHWINTNAPESVMSTQSAQARQDVDPYVMTIRHAAALADMVRATRRVAARQG